MRQTIKNFKTEFASTKTSWLGVKTNENPEQTSTRQQANAKSIKTPRYIGMRRILLIGSVAMLMTGCVTPFPFLPGYSRTRSDARQEYYGDRSYYGDGPLYVNRPYYSQSRYYDRPYFYNDQDRNIEGSFMTHQVSEKKGTSANRKKTMANQFVKKPKAKSKTQGPILVKEVARDEPKPLQAGGSVKEAGETMRSLETNRLPVESDHRLVGAVEGNHPERECGGFGHDPATTVVRGIMLKKAYYCFDHQPVEEAREIMREHHLQYLPVVDDKMRVIGMVALKDLPAMGAPATKQLVQNASRLARKKKYQPDN